MAKNPEEMEKALAFVKSTGARRLCMKPAKGIYGKVPLHPPLGRRRPSGKKITDTPPHGISMLRGAGACPLRLKSIPRMLCMPMPRVWSCRSIVLPKAENGGAVHAGQAGGRSARKRLEEAKACCERLAEAFGSTAFQRPKALRSGDEARCLKSIRDGRRHVLRAKGRLRSWSLVPVGDVGFLRSGRISAIEEGMIISAKGSLVCAGRSRRGKPMRAEKEAQSARGQAGDGPARSWPSVGLS